MMTITSPFQLVLIDSAADADIEPFRHAIIRAFAGGLEEPGYFASGDDLGIDVRHFQVPPSLAASALLDAAAHSLVVVLADTVLIGASTNADTWRWVEEAWKHCKAAGGRHALIVAQMEERMTREITTHAPALESLQFMTLTQLGEKAIRAASLSLKVIHEARLLVARGLPSNTGVEERLRLFISHAKLDGLPLAAALQHQIAAVPWLSAFYDAKDLPAGCDWQLELERGVRSSLIVILRTEHYDERYWCQQEARWADEYAAPAVLVDARTRLSHPGASLPFGRIPTVRIPDGNLFRILFAALREAFRFSLFVRKVEDMKASDGLGKVAAIQVFSFQPSMTALLKACDDLAARASPHECVIVYPDPPMGAGNFEAAAALLDRRLPGGKLGTPISLSSGGIA